MQYINKIENASDGYQIVDTLLEDAWNDDERRYIDFNYNGLGKAKYRDEIIKLALLEQMNFCCYCMKKIILDETSLEHIIPQAVSDTDFDKYMRFSELSDRIIHKMQFDTQIKVDVLEKYPHDIAYHNLIASCRSKIYCNSERKDKYIEPIMYDIDIRDKVWYEKNGSISSDEFMEYLDKIGLNHVELKSVRKLWQLFSKSFEALPNMIEITQKDLENMIYDAIATDDNIVMLVEQFTGNDNGLTKIFRKYEWFFSYYKS
jgi:hypothetical protein